MKAMILAAGLGKRMRPLTEHTPKPLLKVKGKALIEYHLEALQAAGISDVVINTHWLGEQLSEALGDGSRWNLHIHYSPEKELLETAGGIRYALEHLKSPDNAPFFLVNGDIYTDLDITQWIDQNRPRLDHYDACLALVNNPDHNPGGDFCLAEKGIVTLPDAAQKTTLTYSGIGLFKPSMFAQVPNGPAPLGPLLRQLISRGQIAGSRISSRWSDIGTPERLEALEQALP